MSKIKSLLIVFIVIFSFGCEKKEVVLDCNYTNFKYYQDQPDLIGEMSGDYIIIGVKAENSDESIKTFVESIDYFDTSYEFI